MQKIIQVFFLINFFGINRYVSIKNCVNVCGKVVDFSTKGLQVGIEGIRQIFPFPSCLKQTKLLGFPRVIQSLPLYSTLSDDGVSKSRL